MATTLPLNHYSVILYSVYFALFLLYKARAGERQKPPLNLGCKVLKDVQRMNFEEANICH